MKATFADTFYYLAVLHRDDVKHQQAVDLRPSLRGGSITTTWVLTEVADALAAPKDRHAFVALLERLRADKKVTIVPATQDLFDRGVDFYRNRPDKEWSLTDCISFVVMKDRGIEEALTGDRHFEQAGFKALLK